MTILCYFWCTKVKVQDLFMHNVFQSLWRKWYGGFLSLAEGLLTHPTYPGWSIFSYISLQNVKNHLHEKQKVVLVRRVTCPAMSPFCDGKVILLSQPTFLHINTLVLDNQSMHEQCWTGQRRQPFSHINTYLSWLGWDGQPSTQEKSSLYMTCITYLSW